jgi:hypothetical protein
VRTNWKALSTWTPIPLTAVCDRSSIGEVRLVQIDDLTRQLHRPQKKTGSEFNDGRPEPASWSLTNASTLSVGMRLDDAALCGLCEPLLIFGFFQQERP